MDINTINNQVIVRPNNGMLGEIFQFDYQMRLQIIKLFLLSN